MIYDYKSDDIVQDCISDDLIPIIEDIESEYKKLRRYEQIDIFVPSNIAREILGSILEDLDDVFVHTESHNDLLYNDKNDVCITIGYDGMIFVENANWDDKNMTSCDGVMNYVYDSFKKSDIDKMSSDLNPILVFGLQDDILDGDDECDCKYTELSKDSDGETHGFTQSWTDDNGSYHSRSFYSSDTDLVKEMLKNW